MLWFHHHKQEKNNLPKYIENMQQIRFIEAFIAIDVDYQFTKDFDQKVILSIQGWKKIH